MRVPRSLIGRRCEVHWIDPASLSRTSRHSDHHDVPKGRAALGKWKTRGVIEFIEEDVVMIQKAIAEDIDEDEQMHQKMEYDAVPESLIYRVIETPDGTVHGDPLT